MNKCTVWRAAAARSLPVRGKRVGKEEAAELGAMCVTKVQASRRNHARTSTYGDGGRSRTCIVDGALGGRRVKRKLALRRT